MTPINNINKFEEMLDKLMEQMGTMLNLLTTVVSKLLVNKQNIK